LHDVGYGPEFSRKSGFQGWWDSQSLVDSHEIVVDGIKGNSMAQIINLFTKSVCEARNMSIMYA
jgi:hypothetical protein